MLFHRLQRWVNFKPTSLQRLVAAGYYLYCHVCQSFKIFVLCFSLFAQFLVLNLVSLFSLWMIFLCWWVYRQIQTHVVCHSGLYQIHTAGDQSSDTGWLGISRLDSVAPASPHPPQGSASTPDGSHNLQLVLFHLVRRWRQMCDLF